jgi:Tol biopolymer transport system component
VSSEIDVMRPDGSARRRLIGTARDPAYSPSGGRIAFASYRDRNGRLCYGDRCLHAGELYVANANGAHRRRLTRTRALNEAHPSWLGDGSRIAYQRGRVFGNAEVPSLLEVNSDGSCRTQILAGSGRGAWYGSPAWRPTRSGHNAGRLRC